MGLTGMESRRIEMACGVLGGALGFIAIGIALFAPVWQWYCDRIPGQSSCNLDVTGIQYAVRVRQEGVLLFYTIWIAVPSLGIVLLAIWHSRTRSLLALFLLWVCTLLLGAQTVFSITASGAPLDVGGFLVPACVLALGASIVGTVAAQQRVPAQV
jgi:hypothetical protein